MENVWDADFTSAKNIRKEKRDKHFKGKQVKGKTTQQDYVAFDPQTDQADPVNFVTDMELSSSSGDAPRHKPAPFQPLRTTYGVAPMAEAVPEVADYSSSSGEDSDLDTDLAVVAASTLGLDPYCSGDQDECQEVRVALDCNSRWEDLFNLWKETIAYTFPEDKEKQARLTLALRREVETWQCAYQDKANQDK